jgi:hypothetical protein
MWSAVRVAFESDRRHGNVWELGEPRLERIVLRLTFSEPEAPSSVSSVMRKSNEKVPLASATIQSPPLASTFPAKAITLE